MKKLLGLLSTITIMASAAVCGAATTVTSVTEDFSNTNASGQFTLDKLNGAETIAPMMVSQYLWGGYCAGVAGTGTSNAISIQTADYIQFAKNACVAGTRCYTRFDTTSPLPANATSSSIIVNASRATAGAVLNFKQLNANNVFSQGPMEMAVLIHTSSGTVKGWFQSSSKSISESDLSTTVNTPIKFPFASSAWQQLNTADAGVIDMEEVDNGGENSIVLPSNTGVAPDLSVIDGMGIMLVNAPTFASGAGINQPLFDSMSITDVVPPAAPANVKAVSSLSTAKVSLTWDAVTGATGGYNVYRSVFAGGPYTKLNAAAVTTTSYDDVTIAPNVQYFYVITALDGSTPANESLRSAEVSGKFAPVSSAQRWMSFR